MSWLCPYCNHSQVITDDNFVVTDSSLHIGYEIPRYGVFEAIRCLNRRCDKLTLTAYLFDAKRNVYNVWEKGTVIQNWPLLPNTRAKTLPEYIPASLIEDYNEACLIKHLSPKASATLSRRCMQGMIRDFAGISKPRLIDEIRELRRQVENGSAPKGVTDESLDAIDSVREIGNIGAHMEKNINEIIDVDADEAQILINLLEMLFDEWYVARHAREQRLAAVLTLKAEKDAQKSAIKSAKSTN